MADLAHIVAGVLLLLGSSFALVAAVGTLRLPDLYTRMHAASKAGALGSGVLLLALAVDSGELGVVTRAIAGIVFLLLTAPVAAHLLARAAYFAGVRPAPATRIDELQDRWREIKRD